MNRRKSSSSCPGASRRERAATSTIAE
jgi:hypothetical protein